jgi:hypothetical protein
MRKGFVLFVSVEVLAALLLVTIAGGVAYKSAKAEASHSYVSGPVIPGGRS